MRLVGRAVRGGSAEGPIVLDPGASLTAKGPAPIAAFGRIAGSDARLTEHAAWAGVTVEAFESSSEAPSTVGPPTVTGIDLDVLRAGEWVHLNGSTGTVDLPDVAEVKVVTSFLERNDGRILLLRRSSKVGSFQGRWAAVSGFLEDPTPEEQARREIREETSIDPSQSRLVSAGRPVYARDGMTVFTVHPFRFRVTEAQVVIDWEHSEFEWVEPGEIERRDTVPKLDRVWRAVSRG